MKKIISLFVVLTMVISCLGVTAFANEQLPACKATILTDDALSIEGINLNDSTVTMDLDYGVKFEAVDTAETIETNPYKDYLCDFAITFSEEVNAILAGAYGDWGWIALNTDKGEKFAGVTEFGYKFPKNQEVFVMATAINGLTEEGLIKNPEKAPITYAQVIEMVQEFSCGVKIVDETAVDVTVELCLFDPANPDEKIVIGNPFTYNHEAAKAPEAVIEKLTNDELNVKGFDLSGNEFNEKLDFGMRFAAVDETITEENPFWNYSVDFEIEFSEDVTAVLAGQYDGFSESWMAVKAEEGVFDGIGTKGYSFTKDESVRVMQKAFELHPSLEGTRMRYAEIVEFVKEFNCGVKITENKDVDITLRLCLYETDELGNETGHKYIIGELPVFEYKALSIPEDEDVEPEKVVEIINNATSINDESKEAVKEAIVKLPAEQQVDIKPEVIDAVAEEVIDATDDENIGVEIKAIENTDGADMLFVVKTPEDGELELKEDQVAIDIDAYKNGVISDETEFKGELDAPIVVKIPLRAFGEGVTGLSALYHEHDGVIEKIDFLVRDSLVIFTVNKFSSFIGTPVTLAAGQAAVELVELTAVAEGTTAFDVVLKGDVFRTIQNFGAGEFVVNVKDVLDINGDGSNARADFVLNPAIAAEKTSVYQLGNKYVISVEDTLGDIWSKDETLADNNAFVLGTITVTGWGKKGTLEVSNILMNKHVDSLINGGTDTTVIPTNAVATATFDIPVPQRTLDVEVYLAHGVKNNVAPYQAMTVTVTKGGVVVEETPLGAFDPDVEFDTTTNTYKVSYSLDLEAGYVVTVSGAGYRTASKNVSMTEDKTVKFWNNVLATGETNFLAGDIVGDNIIDIYDLSAVVAYFDQRPNDTVSVSDYSKYDLNRDGVINSKDVVIVTNGWNK